MSDKFKTVVTTQGLEFLNQAIANEKDLLITKAVASSTAYNSDSLVDLTDTNYNNASHDQETMLNKIEPRGDGSLAFEILFDGYDVRYDYTLNTVFLIAEVDGKERLFAVIKANQPQYINAYEGGSRTNLQINFALQLANQNVAIKINSAALATTKDLNDLKDEITGKFEAGDRSLKQEITKNKQEAERTANGLRASIISVDGKIDNLSVGGRNYLQGSLNFKWPEGVGQENVTPSFETQGDATVAHLSSQSNGGIYTKWKKAFPNGELQVGDDYTLSFDAKGLGVFKTVKNESEAGDGSLSGTSLTSNWKRYSVSGKINSLNKAYVIFFNGGYDAYIKRVKIEKGNKPTDYTQAPEDIESKFNSVNNTLKAYKANFDLFKDGMSLRVAEIEESISNRKMPTSWFLDRTTTPWTIWFDNGCGIQFPDYPTSGSMYGYGHSFENTLANKFAAYPLVYNIINCARGVLTLEDFVKRGGGDYVYWSPTTKVLDPIQDARKYNWTNAVGNRDTNNDSLKRKPNFARVMYELGIWSDADVESLGAVRR